MRHKILYKLLGCFAIVLLLFALIAGLLFTSLFADYTVAHHEAEFLQKAENIALSLEEHIQSGSDPHAAFSAYAQTVELILPEELWFVDKAEYRISQGSEEQFVSYAALPAAARQLLDDVFLGETVFGQEFAQLLSEPCLTLGIPINDANGNVIAALLVHAAIAERHDVLHQGIYYLLIASVAALGIALIASIVMSSVFLRPIRSMQIAANHMAEGDYAVSGGVKSKDELGALAKDLDTLAHRLDEASKESKALEQLRRDFVANVSHELRTPITVLRSSLEALCDGIVEDQSEVEEYHHAMLSETIHLQRMIGDLIEVSRLQTPDYVMHFEPLDPAEVVDDAFRSTNQLAGKKDIVLLRDLDPAAGMICGDYARIRQLILILLDNAIKFSPERSAISIGLHGTVDACILTVTDEGPGVAQEDLPYIFDRFYASAKTANPQGTGLGLYIAKQIAERHNAEIRLQNGTKGGCTVTVAFPLCGSKPKTFA